VRTLAIGDIHGALRAFESLLAKIDPGPDDVLVFLGDFIDRGPDSAGVLRRLIALSTQREVIALRGNHEQMILDARNSQAAFRDWLRNGGDATLKSYGGLRGSLQDVPDEHWRFIAAAVDYYETPTHFFVHASAYPEVKLSEQPPEILRWGRFNDPPEHISGKVMVCGHTPQKSGKPRNIGHAVCIDTLAYRARGWLTCLDTSAGTVWQANNSGRAQMSHISDY
jgi:serine/threonine protein phosphatase 1